MHDVEDTFRDRSEEVDFENTFSDDENDAEALQKADEERETAMARDVDSGGGGEESENEYLDDSGADSDTGDKEMGRYLDLWQFPPLDYVLHLRRNRIV